MSEDKVPSWDETAPAPSAVPTWEGTQEKAPPLSGAMQTVAKGLQSWNNHSLVDEAGDIAHATTAHLPMADLGAKIAAHGYASTQMLHNMFRDSPDKRTYDDYVKEGLANEAGSRGEIQKNNPTAWKAGSVLAPIEGLAAPLPGGGMKGLVGAGTRIAGNAALSGLDRGSQGLNNPSLMDTDKALQGAEEGGGIAAAMEAGMPILGKVAAGPVGSAAKSAFGAVADKAADFAEQRAFKAAVGNQQKVTADAVRTGRVNEIGRNLLDNGVVSFGDNAANIAEKAKIARGDAGEALEKIRSDGDQAAPGLVSGPNIAARIRDFTARRSGQGNKAVAERLNAIADEYEGMGHMSLDKAQTEKNSFEYRPGDSTALDKQSNNALKAIIGDEMETGVRNSQAVAQSKPQFAETANTGSGSPAGVVTREGGPMLQNAEAVQPDALEAYQNAKIDYGASNTAANAATILAARQKKNASLGLLPMISGAAAGVAAAVSHGNPALALAAPAVAVGHKIAQTRGNAALAVGADKLSDVLQATPEAFGKFAGVLQQAAQRSPQALAVTHYMLSQQEPEYSQMFQGGKP